MNVLSLFDGMSCGRIALERAGLPVTNYFASEIDPYAIKVSKKNYPDIFHLGSVTEMTGGGIGNIDLLIGGSPCQGFSFAGKQLNFEDARSKLFFEYVRLLRALKPKYFLLENVRMKKEYQNIISEQLGVEPIEINSSLVSGQNRRRLYWTNIPNVTQPEDKGILLKDVLESGISDRDKSHCIISSIGRTTNREYFKKNQGQMVAEEIHAVRQGGEFIEKGDKSMCLDANYYKGPDNHGTLSVIIGGAIRGRYVPTGKTEQRLEANGLEKANALTTVQKDSLCIEVGKADLNGHDFLKRVYSPEGKSPTLTSVTGGNQERKVAVDEVHWRKLTPVECERLQTLPDNYTAGVSNSQRYKMIGNGWTVDVIAHILKEIKI